MIAYLWQIILFGSSSTSIKSSERNRQVKHVNMTGKTLFSKIQCILCREAHFDNFLFHCCYLSGKWFNYGILFIVILLDLNMWKNQIFYTPYQYGQYVDDFGRIYTVMDQYSLDHANSSTLTFEYRNVTINPDTKER